MTSILPSQPQQSQTQDEQVTATNSTTTNQTRIKSSQNGGVMEGWNDVPLLESLLKNNVPSSSVASSRNRKKRVTSYTYPPVDPLNPYSAPRRTPSQVRAGTIHSNGSTPPPPPPPPPAA